MLIRQSKNCFIRFYDNDELGYITNQLNRHDRSYQGSGVDFLRQITRKPRSLEDILASLNEIFDVDINTLRSDFIEFIEDLAKHKFVVIGDTELELDDNDLEFSYSMENPKTFIDDYTQTTKELVERSTQDYMLKHDSEKPRLAGLQFELTSRCNERCIHCYIPNAKKNTGVDMSFQKFKFIIDQYVEMGGLNVTLSGGEVLMNKDIIKILRYCREKDLVIILLTNLIVLKDEHIKVLKEVNVASIQVSLYSMNPNIHDMITTVKGSFEKTKNAIEKLHDADIPVQISCPVMKANKDGYVEVMKYAHGLLMKSSTDYIMMAQSDMNTSNLSNRLNIDETEKVLKDILAYDNDYRESTLKQFPMSSIPIEEYSEMPLCGAGFNDLCVTVNGDVYPCAGWQSYIVGNVYKSTLKYIWDNSSKLIELRKIRKRDFPKCMTCEARDYCSMCLVRNFNESGGDMFKINKHFCDVAFLTKRIVEEWKAQKEHE